MQLQEIAATLQLLCDRVQSLESLIAKLVTQTMSKEEKNMLRRQYYRRQRAAELKGRLVLPDRHILNVRDKRLEPFVPQWAEQGMKFGAADQAGPFLTWFVHEWNCNTYLKKPITFSGSSFRVWTGHLRHPYGPGDLMHYFQKRSSMLLRNEAEAQDFHGRPWWEWAYCVLFPVYTCMLELGFEELPCNFKRGIRLLLGGMGDLQVGGTAWDMHESREAINKMFKKIGPELLLMLKACYRGLRVSPCPVQVPQVPQGNESKEC